MTLYTAVLIGAGVLLVAAICRKPAVERPCRETADGQHELMNETDGNGWYLRCLACKCRSDGWAIPRPEPKPKQVGQK